MEHTLTLALLHAYEQFLMERVNVTAVAAFRAVVYQPEDDVSPFLTSLSSSHGAKLSTNAPIFGEQLTFDQFARHRYSVFPEVHADRLLLSLRVALSGLQQEQAVYPFMVQNMQHPLSLRSVPYEVVRTRRAVWARDRQALLNALLDQGTDKVRTSTLAAATVEAAGSATTTTTPKPTFSSSCLRRNMLAINGTCSPTDLTDAEYLEVLSQLGKGSELSALSDRFPDSSSFVTTTRKRTVRTHFVTYASNQNHGLVTLMNSAIFAGVDLKVCLRCV
jgi:hypothetical protein